jgi:hypothetical protein
LFVKHRQNDWAEWLAVGEFALNDKVSSSTGYTPFYLNSAQHPWKGKEPKEPSMNARVEDFVKTLTGARDAAKKALEKTAENMKKYRDKRRNPSREYKYGDLVWLEATNLKTDQPSKKLGPKRLGPFPIEKKVGQGAYKLKLPASWKIHPVFNEYLLTPHVEPRFPSQKQDQPPLPEIVNNDLEYEVEEILDSRMRRSKLQYLVKWKGYPTEENTWEPEENVKNAASLVALFHKTHPSAPRRLSILNFQRLENLTETKGPRQQWWNGKTMGKESRGRDPQEGGDVMKTCDPRRFEAGDIPRTLPTPMPSPNNPQQNTPHPHPLTQDPTHGAQPQAQQGAQSVSVHSPQQDFMVSGQAEPAPFHCFMDTIHTARSFLLGI